jgi:pimeloyl-ACP methyl ester carboxylesterase
VTTELDLNLDDGRTLHVYDTGTGPAGPRLAVFWHHGTPNLGPPPAPLFATSDRLGIRWVSYDRPGYGGSTPDLGRSVGSAAVLVAAVADALGIDRFAVMGHSGGGPHALACGALLPGRAEAVVGVAGMAPFDADGLDWFAGMTPSGVASLRAAAGGRAAKERHEASDAEYDPEFTSADLAAFAGEWSWFGSVVGPAVAAGPGGLIDDDLAYVSPWGFDPGEVAAPVLLLHGGRDRVVPSSHGEWLARRCPSAELRLSPGEGHISILGSAPDALAWLRERAG